MLRAVGMGDDDWDKPQVGVASSWNEVTPCNMPLSRLAQRAKAGVRASGRLPARVRDDLGERRHLDGPRGHASVVGEPRDHRRLRRDGDARRALRCARRVRRMRQEPAGHAHGGGPTQPALGVRLRRVDPARSSQWQGDRCRERVRSASARAPPARSPWTSSVRSSAMRARPRGRARACSPRTRWRRSARRSGCRCRAAPRRPPSTVVATTTRTPRAKQ